MICVEMLLLIISLVPEFDLALWSKAERNELVCERWFYFIRSKSGRNVDHGMFKFLANDQL